MKYLWVMLLAAFVSTSAHATVNVAAGEAGKDWQKDLQKIFDDAAQHGENVHLAAGLFQHSGILSIQGIEVSGEGAATIVEGTTPDNSSIALTGSGSRLTGMKLVFKGTGRVTTDESSLVLAKNAVNFSISHLVMNGSNSTGIFVLGSNHGTIEDNDISNTLADSIHITGGSSDIIVHGNTTHNSGDDGIAVVSYEKNDKRVARVMIYDNNILYNKYARGISVVGGEDVDIHGNTIVCNQGFAGLYIASEPSFQTYGVSNVRAHNNIIRGCGGVMTGHGAVMIYTGYRDNDHITISNNDIVDSPFVGIIVAGKGNHAIALKDNTIKGAGGGPILQRDAGEPVEISGNVVQ